MPSEPESTPIAKTQEQRAVELENLIKGHSIGVQKARLALRELLRGASDDE